MALTHEFGIINNFDENKDYSSPAPENFNCISVDDDLIQYLSKYLKNMNTYHHEFSRKEKGLAYHGVTIIPPKSLMFFYDIVTTTNQFKKSPELASLAYLIITAKKDERHLIHYGI